MLVSLPHLTDTEFEHACNKLYSRFLGCADKQSQWLSVEQRREKETFFLSITTALSTEHSNADSDDPSVEEEELVEPDEEVIQTPERCQSLVRYDIFLSPVYQVPVLYIKVTAGSKSSAPSMMSLYEQLVPRQYLDETRTAGIIGGVSLTACALSYIEEDTCSCFLGSPSLTYSCVLHPPVPDY